MAGGMVYMSAKLMDKSSAANSFGKWSFSAFIFAVI
jgi:hypothetical protein